MNEFNEREQSIENPTSPLHYDEQEKETLSTQLIQTLVLEEELPKDPAPKGMKLESVNDPITDKPVAPPPYVVTLHAIEEVLRGWDTRGLEAEDKQNIR